MILVYMILVYMILVYMICFLKLICFPRITNPRLHDSFSRIDLFSSIYLALVRMDRPQVRAGLQGMAENLVKIRQNITRQIRREMKVLKNHEKLVHSTKVSIIKLKRRRKFIEQSAANLALLRNDMVYMTNEKVEAYNPSTSASEIDTDLLSTTSEESDSEIEVRMPIYMESVLERGRIHNINCVQVVRGNDAVLTAL